MKVYPKKKLIIGIDEVGRGSLAGPVCSVAVSLGQIGKIGLTQDLYLSLKDSKLLSKKKRLQIFEEITKQGIIYAIGWASVVEIERLNILQASLLSMYRAYESYISKLNINVPNILIKIDGIHTPKGIRSKSKNCNVEIEMIKNGDSLIKEISAASIIAKVIRDLYMQEISKLYPNYNFQINMGYGTLDHLKRIKKFGPCLIHRNTFSPIKNL